MLQLHIVIASVFLTNVQIFAAPSPPFPGEGGMLHKLIVRIGVNRVSTIGTEVILGRVDETTIVTGSSQEFNEVTRGNNLTFFKAAG